MKKNTKVWVFTLTFRFDSPPINMYILYASGLTNESPSGYFRTRNVIYTKTLSVYFDSSLQKKCFLHLTLALENRRI